MRTTISAPVTSSPSITSQSPNQGAGDHEDVINKMHPGNIEEHEKDSPEIVSIHLEEDEMLCLDSSVHMSEDDKSHREREVYINNVVEVNVDEAEACLGTKVMSPMSLKNSSGLFCRICHDGDYETEPLISPCSCSGSVGLVHRACIEKWLSTVNQDTCEICREKYFVSRHSRPFSTWLLTPAVGDDQRNLLGDTVCFLLLTPLTSISAYLCASGAAFYFKQVKKSEAIGLICLASLLVFIYLIWLMLTIRYHCQVWFKWRLNNQDIRLLDVSTNRPKEANKHPNHPVVKSAELVQTNANEAKDAHRGKDERDNQVEIIVEEERSLTTPADVNGSAAKKVLFQDDKSYETSTPDQAPRAGSLNPVENGEISRITPLTPIVISNDPQADTASIVVSSTEDSDIYAQLPRHGSLLAPAYPCPWMPEMKTTLLSIGSGAKFAQVKSRGTFSPNPRVHKSPFSHNKSNQAYEKL